MRILLAIIALVAVVAGCATPGNDTAIGAGAGAVAGAGLGAIIGNQSGHAGGGALIGALAGGLVGGSIGNHMDKQAQELARIAETKRTEQGIITRLRGDILFDSGSASLKAQARGNLQQMAAIIRKYPEDRLTIVGHTDNRGGIATNKALSEERANAVRTELIIGGVPSEHITSVGMGSSQPVAKNNTSSGRAQNRRVELHITAAQTNEAVN